MIERLDSWTVDYGDERGARPVRVPHAWRQEQPVEWEGPAVYRTTLQVPKDARSLVFHGISYEAKIRFNGVEVAGHCGIWDAFAVELADFQGKTVEVEVWVTKNGGQSFPVRNVASGFLPFVFNTFGGIHGEVELYSGEDSPDVSPPAPATRVYVDGAKIYLDEEPFYVRGLLHWGWYPELGHCNPPEETVRKEVRQAKELGFNLVKFCLWAPPHRYLEILKEEKMEAWLELPLWDPTEDPECQKQISSEIEAIIRQYRRHDNIIIWTVGCELSSSTSAEYREYLYQMVRNLSGCPLVKDNSGGAEMYGGDLREFGDFYDFHPYCDTHFYPLVLDSFLPTARKKMPVLLGEFNDMDVHRDLLHLSQEMPFWTSALPELNAQGVRWLHDLPSFIRTARFTQEPGENRHDELVESSRQKALYVRKTVHEWVRARDAISGYVITGWRDTPISTSGFFDDWGQSRFSPDECAAWNGETTLFLIPNRRPPWINGGNRPGYLTSQAHFLGQVFWRVGAHSDRALEAGLVWRVTEASGQAVHRGAAPVQYLEALEAAEVGQIHWVPEAAGDYLLEVEFGDARNTWPVLVVPPLDPLAFPGWRKLDTAHALDDLEFGDGPNVVSTQAFSPAEVLSAGGHAVMFLMDAGTKAAPFWRESAYEFHDSDFWKATGLDAGWERWLNIAPDRVLDADWLAEHLTEHEVLMNRIDVRTYQEAPVLVRGRAASGGVVIVTTLRPFGGMGVQPLKVTRNPVGSMLLKRLLRYCEGGI